MYALTNFAIARTRRALCQPVAGDPRPSHLEKRVPDAILVAHAHLVIGQPVEPPECRRSAMKNPLG